MDGMPISSATRTSERLTRRDVLRLGGLAGASLALTAGTQAMDAASAKRCIFLLLVGGPSQLDTWDPKPNAPGEIRGPFRTIHTRVPGLHITELFPCMADMANRFAIVRSLHHQEAPIHETGLQLLQTGRLSNRESGQPHLGSVFGWLRGMEGSLPPFVILPGPLGSMGVPLRHGQDAGRLGSGHDPVFLSEASYLSANANESHDLQKRYGNHVFGRACLQARHLSESGVGFVLVNMFDRVFDNATWDCHAMDGSLNTTLADYRRTVAPLFDQAYSALLDDLDERGLLESTLVVAAGEFGRTPRLNQSGGRDHWPGVWSALFAGGGVRGGQVVGASDRHGSEPRDRPVGPADFAATIYRALGVSPATRLPGNLGPICDGRPLSELFT